MKAYMIYVTVADKAQARELGRFLVTSQLAACVNIFDQMNSMYVWQGEFQDDQEAVLIAKTTEDRLAELVGAIKQRHSYDCPCIVTWPITGGNPAFLDWIEAQVT